MALPNNVLKYKKDIETNLRFHNLGYLVQYLDNEERMTSELDSVFKNLGNDKIPTELDWLYAQYNVLRVSFTKKEVRNEQA